MKEGEREGMEGVVENDLVYCRVWDKKNGKCRVDNTGEMMGMEEVVVNEIV